MGGWQPAAAATNTDASVFTTGAFPSARQSVGLRNLLLTPFRLQLSGGSLSLVAWGGSKVYNPLGDYTVDIAGVSALAATGLTPSTLYYIFLNCSTGALQVGAVGSSTWTTTSGIRHLTSNTQTLLVGAARCTTGPAWLSCCSLYNVIDAPVAIADGAAQSGIVADTTWKTPSTDMAHSLIQHPDFAIDYNAHVSMFHDAPTAYVGVGIDLGATGTPARSAYGARNGTNAADVNYFDIDATADSTGDFRYITTRVRVQGDDSSSPDTFKITGTISNYLRARYVY